VGVKLVALDIDGTLIPPAHYGHVDMWPDARITAAVSGLQDRGITVVLASGRMFPGTAAIARHLGLSTPVICQQGCSVHLLDGTTVHEFPIDSHAALDVVRYARECGHAYEWFNPLRYLVSSAGESAMQYGRVSGIEPEYMERPEESGVIPTGVGVISSRLMAPDVHRALVAEHGENLHLLDFPDVTVAVAADANKGHALSLICADLGIERHDTVAIGDSVNDASMLLWAGRGVALAHSDRYALDAADEVLAAHENAVADYLERL
jgi:hydroxymethylpyrimidine pyrophosphatase-like HAD family hydrolase